MKFRPLFSLIMIMLFLMPAVHSQDSTHWVNLDSSGHQKTDSSVYQIVYPADTVSKRAFNVFGLYDTLIRADQSNVYGIFSGGLLLSDRQLHSASRSAYEPSLNIRFVEDNDWIFYLFCFMLLCLAVLNISFTKYLKDLFRVILNTSLRQKQIREQLAQAPLPSLLLNIYFFLSSGVFLYFLMGQLKIDLGYGALQSIFICTAIPASIYIVKYLVLMIVFWIFDRKEASENYLFIVFLINKVAGIFLLPFSILLAYASAYRIGIILTLVVIGVVLLIILRLIRGFDAVKSSLSLNIFHYLIFVVAFEFIPLILIYRLLLHVIG